MRDITILGAGGHASVVVDACNSMGRKIRGIIAPELAPGTIVFGAEVLGNDALLEDPAFTSLIEVFVGVGSPDIHRRMSTYCSDRSLDFATVIHASAIVSSFSTIAPGSFVNAGVIINAGSRIGSHCILNTGASVDHDCKLANFAILAPGAVLCGGVDCGEAVFVGAGATVLPSIKLGAGAIIAAGAVVLDNVAPGSTVAGIPARPFKV
jgi:sugar O-acyltransferase (sialic acid O-acetyltransferase NeuD family)